MNLKHFSLILIAASLSLSTYLFLNAKKLDSNSTKGVYSKSRSATTASFDFSPPIGTSVLHDEIFSPPTSHLFDYSHTSFCRLDLVGVDDGKKISRGFGDNDSCLKVQTETSNGVDKAIIYYKGLEGVLVFQGVNDYLANVKLNEQLNEDKFLVNIDVYKDGERTLIKMIFADILRDEAPETKLIINKDIRAFQYEVESNLADGFILSNIEISKNSAGQTRYYGVLRKGINSTNPRSGNDRLGQIGKSSEILKYHVGEVYSNFRRSFMEYSNNGFVLIDIETYQRNDLWLFAHVWKKNDESDPKNWRLYHNVTNEDYHLIKKKMSRWKMRPIDVNYYKYELFGEEFERWNLIYVQDSKMDLMGMHKKWNHSPHNFNYLMINDGLPNSTDKYNHMVVSEKGTIPLLVLAPHSGTEGIEGVNKRVLLEWHEDTTRKMHEPDDKDEIKKICTGYNGHNAVNNDKRTDIIMKYLKAGFASECDEKKPFTVYTKLYRSVADMNRLLKSFRKKPVFDKKIGDYSYEANICAFDTKAAFFPYQAYHDMVEQYVEDIETQFGLTDAIAIDLHGAAVNDENVDIALGYGGAEKLNQHTMLNELLRSNQNPGLSARESRLNFNSSDEITNAVIKLDFLYGTRGLRKQLENFYLKTYPQGHVGLNTGFGYEETDNLNGGFWTRYLSHLKEDDNLAAPNGPRIDTFQIEVMHDGFRDEDDNAEEVGDKLGRALCRTWKANR